MMLVVVAYDVSTESEGGRKRLRRVAKVCEDCGQWVQNSVFQCLVDAGQWVKLRARLLKEISDTDTACDFTFWEITGSGGLNMWGLRWRTIRRGR